MAVCCNRCRSPMLAGLTTREDAERHPYRASRIVESIADLLAELG